MIFALTVVEVVAISYVYGMRRVLEDIKFMLGIDLGIYWKFCWGILIPICLTFMFVYFAATFEQITYADIPYPEEAICKASNTFEYCIEKFHLSTFLPFHRCWVHFDGFCNLASSNLGFVRMHASG